MTLEPPPGPEVSTLPAWSDPFRLDRRDELSRPSLSRAIAGAPDWMDARGEGITVAVIDSGVERDHPLVGGRLTRSMQVDLTGEEPRVVEDPKAVDLVGHGTACAGIIHGLAPAAELVSIRVLGPDNKGKGVAFAYALDWVVEQRIPVVNLSLSSRSEELFATFHDLADQAYFANCLLVCSASNVPGQASYPSLFSSVISVAAHDTPEPLTYLYNPHPPVEFGAWGVNVPVAWKGGSTIVATGNSFAAPHITGIIARIRSAYPHATPFEVKTLLASAAAGAGNGDQGGVRSP